MTGKIFAGIPAKRRFEFFTMLFIAVFFGLSAMAHAEEITYTGDEKQLQETPVWFPQASSYSIFPGTKTAPRSSGNKVTVNYNEAREVTNPNFVFGGLSKSGDVSGNSVVLLNGLSNKIFGGWSSSGKVFDNTITISGNFVVENGGTSDGRYVQRDIYGGWSNDGSAVTNNRINISGGAVAGDVCGGCSFGGDASGNKILIDGGSVTGDVDGGYSEKGSATDNIIVISGGAIGGDVCGGCSFGGDASGNKIFIDGGSVTGDVDGGYSEKGSATENIIVISGGAIGGDVCGGCSFGGDASGNKIFIADGSVTGDVAGGYSEKGSATDNIIIIISGRPNLAKAHIWGGYAEDLLGDDFTGNTLNLKNSGISAAGVGNFEYYNFDLPKGLKAGAVMLSVKEAVYLKGTTVAISLQDGAMLKKGDKIALIRSADGVSNAPKNKNYKVKHGGAIYTFSTYTDENNLWVEVTKISKAAK